MLTAHPGNGPARILSDPHCVDAQGAIWLDLLDATEAERALAERISGLRVPSRDEISAIEASSRLQRDGDILTLSTTLVARPDGLVPRATPLALVLSPRLLLTVRYSQHPAFDAFSARLAAGLPDDEDDAPGSAAVFLGLMEALVDRAADVLEHVGGELAGLSHRIFHAEIRPGRGGRSDAALRDVLRRIGRAGDLVSQLRDALLGLGRVTAFADEADAAWMPRRLHARCASLRADIASLNDYDAQLTGKVQFLLDATLGFLNIEQNNGIKVLTVVSLVGIPPTLIASIYGMNFKDMPELNWTYGYPYALGLIALGIVAPLALFRWRGWL